MIDGETDPLKLAQLARGPMRRKIPDLAQVLTGTLDADHAALAKAMLLRLRLVEQAQAELDRVIAAACEPWRHQIELLQTIPRGRGEDRAGHRGGDRRRHGAVPTAAHLAAWAGLAPAMHQSAGRQTPAGKRRGNKWLAASRQSGHTIHRSCLAGPAAHHGRGPTGTETEAADAAVSLSTPGTESAFCL
jgi:transposase